MAFLILTYISSSETSRTQLYSSDTYTRFIEKVNRLSLFGGFAPSGWDSQYTFKLDYNAIGVGASGSSEDWD